MLGQDMYASPEILVLSPLPCWKHLSEEVRRQLVGEMIADIEAEAALREASAKLRAGDRLARFPAGSFPPALPFVAG